MIVEVVGGAGAAPEVRVSDVEDLAHLQLAVGALTEEEADQALRDAGLGRLADADTGFLDIAALKAAAGPQAAEWAGRFDDMVESARGKGWVGDDGASLQAHVESAASG
ncbi:hypothetical protein SAMN05661080_03337 [Modestobacter sp. DSM 44400]|uniref:hypothetical protein n=1 Tax=Modestobacter sp. DSM 44400 TaxID=1550230 RepID=UPI00089B504B|nr:hypothetical protein [Modestobacter sp. DSM 44400]SDY39497.1 hypothetical protein SAMN05661080_03337 [Modestobacter sp. DSM 44400]